MGGLDTLRHINEVFEELGLKTNDLRKQMESLQRAIYQPTPEEVLNARADLLRMQEELRE